MPARMTVRLPRTVLLAYLLLAGALAACRQEASVTFPACPESDAPAIILTLEDEANQALTGATLTYRADDQPWQEWPERTGAETVIRGGPGAYELALTKPGHESVNATLVVAETAGDACRADTTQLTLEMARISCPEAPAPLLVTLENAVAELDAFVVLPEAERQALPCVTEGPGACRQFATPLKAAGSVELSLEGLPGLGQMQVIDERATYDPSSLALQLDHRGRQETVTLTGADAATLTFPVRLDEANCLLADFRDLTLTLEPDPAATEPRPPLAVSYLGNLTMTNLGADACQTEPILKPLRFGVDLPAGTPLADVQVLIHFGDGWQRATCAADNGAFTCRASVPNPLRDRPFAVRAVAGELETIGMQIPFSGLCLLFD